MNPTSTTASRPNPTPVTQRRPAAVRVMWVAVTALVLTGCATGKDAVATGTTFSFVSPGGQTVITYDPPASRGTVLGLFGDNLLQPGHPIGLTDFPGQVVVLNIWGSWCGPCRAEAPDLEQTYEATKATGVTLLGIDVRDDRDAATDFIRDRKVTYLTIIDPPGRSLKALHGFPRNTVPATIVLDRNHRVAAVFLTRIRVSQLLPVVRRIAAETANPGPPP